MPPSAVKSKTTRVKYSHSINTRGHLLMEKRSVSDAYRLIQGQGSWRKPQTIAIEVRDDYYDEPGYPKPVIAREVAVLPYRFGADETWRAFDRALMDWDGEKPLDVHLGYGSYARVSRWTYELGRRTSIDHLRNAFQLTFPNRFGDSVWRNVVDTLGLPVTRSLTFKFHPIEQRIEEVPTPPGRELPQDRSFGSVFSLPIREILAQMNSTFHWDQEEVGRALEGEDGNGGKYEKEDFPIRGGSFGSINGTLRIYDNEVIGIERVDDQKSAYRYDDQTGHLNMYMYSDGPNPSPWWTLEITPGFVISSTRPKVETWIHDSELKRAHSLAANLDTAYKKMFPDKE